MSDTELLNIFWEEVSEHLDDLNRSLLQIEMTSPDDDAEAYRAAVREMNRVDHSMKGAARAVGINVIETIAHYMEEVFSAAMSSGLRLSPDVCDTMYDSLDLIQNVAGGEDPDEAVLTSVLASLEAMVAITSAGADTVPAPDNDAPPPAPAEEAQTTDPDTPIEPVPVTDDAPSAEPAEVASPAGPVDANAAGVTTRSAITFSRIVP